MKSPIPYFRDFPADFQKETAEEILKVLGKSESVQLVGTKGSGKSLFLRSMLANANFTGKFDIFLVDFNLLSGFRVSDFWNLINIETKGKLEDYVAGDKKALLLMDSFDYAYRMIPDCVGLIKGIHGKYRDYVNMITTVENEIIHPAVLGKSVYLKPLNKRDFEWFWKGIDGSQKYKEVIYEISGGHMGLIKRLNEIVEAGDDFELAVKNPRQFPHLNYQLELLKESLGSRKETPDIPLYQAFVGLGGRGELTKLEQRAFESLLDVEGGVVAREELIEKIWGKNASIGTSDHALDQLMHRLKNKLLGRYEVRTVRGRGYKILKG